MCLYGAVSKIAVLTVSINVVVGSNLGEQNLFFFFPRSQDTFFHRDVGTCRDFQVSMAVIGKVIRPFHCVQLTSSAS